jgi:hypothetical protein
VWCIQPLGQGSDHGLNRRSTRFGSPTLWHFRLDSVQEQDFRRAMSEPVDDHRSQTGRRLTSPCSLRMVLSHAHQRSAVPAGRTLAAAPPPRPGLPRPDRGLRRDQAFSANSSASETPGTIGRSASPTPAHRPAGRPAAASRPTPGPGTWVPVALIGSGSPTRQARCPARSCASDQLRPAPHGGGRNQIQRRFIPRPGPLLSRAWGEVRCRSDGWCTPV